MERLQEETLLGGDPTGRGLLTDGLISPWGMVSAIIRGSSSTPSVAPGLSNSDPRERGQEHFRLVIGGAFEVEG